MTVRDLIKKSLLQIGAIAPGETPSASESSDALVSLNAMISSWNTDGFMIYQNTREAFSLVASQSSYTIGVGGNFNTSNPMLIEQASIIDTNSNPAVEYGLRINSTQEYANIPDKALISKLPTDLYFKRGPVTSQIIIYPVPSENSQIVLYSRKPFTAFASLNDSVSLPEGYERALYYNLALELAAEYGRAPSDLVYKFANDSKALIRRVNMDPIYETSDLYGLTQNDRRPFNIYRGE